MGKILSHQNYNQNEIRNAVVQVLSSDPSSPVEGQIYYNSTSDRLRQYTGAAWVEYGTGTGGGDVSQTANSGGAGRMKVSAGADKTITDYAGGAGIVKSDGNGVVSVATVGTDYVTGSSTNTLTNKTFDANGTGNSITNLETGDFATNVIDNDSTLAANSATRLATQQATKAYVDNSVQGLSWKQAVRAATSAAGTLASSFENGDIIDGVTLATGDRILIKDQATASENGIYTVNATGAPTRALDANTGAELVNATVFVSEGTANADTQWTLSTNAPITVNTTGLTFVQKDAGSVPTATTTTPGKVELADATEAEARSSTTLATTPASLANFPVKKIFTIGDGSAAQIDVTHNLGTKEVITQVREAANDQVIECDVTNFSTTVVRLNFTVAPATNALKVVVMG